MRIEALAGDQQPAELRAKAKAFLERSFDANINQSAGDAADQDPWIRTERLREKIEAANKKLQQSQGETVAKQLAKSTARKRYSSAWMPRRPQPERPFLAAHRPRA